MNSISREIQLTDDQIEAAFRALGHGIALGYGDEDHVTVTHDTLDQFRGARRQYCEPGRLIERKVGDYSALVIEGVRALKGQQRRDLIVIDFGPVRASYLA